MQRLDMACKLPNLCKGLLGQYLNEYKPHSPRTADKELVAIQNDMEKLIGNKLRLFPDIHRQIVGVQIGRVGSKNRMDVVSVTLEYEHRTKKSA